MTNYLRLSNQEELDKIFYDEINNDKNEIFKLVNNEIDDYMYIFINMSIQMNGSINFLNSNLTYNKWYKIYFHRLNSIELYMMPIFLTKEIHKKLGNIILTEKFDYYVNYHNFETFIENNNIDKNNYKYYQ